MIRLFPILLLATTSSATFAAEKSLTYALHHLRNVEPREWSHYPENAENPELAIDFDLDQVSTYKLLTLQQSGVKQAWQVQLNERKLGQLERDHNTLHLALEVPAKLLKPTGNRLVISSTSEEADDIRVGKILLHQQTREELTAGAELSISVTDAVGGGNLPCRLTISDDTGALVLLGAKSNDRLAVRAGVVYTLDGRTTFGLRPGSYKIWASRGFEYSLATAEIEIKGGDRRELALKLRREVPTPGLIASDTHLHTGEFARHGNATLIERLITLAGEGIELPISTEHDQHVDYAPEAKRIGADKFFTPVIGCEVTTSEGHFNSFPIVAGSQPAQHRLRNWPQVFNSIYGTPGVKIVILNHARDLHGKFRPFGPDQFDAGSGTFIDGRKLRANGLELINSGAQQSDPMRLVHDWFALLKSGHKIAGIGSSDSHTVNFAIAGQARTYVPCPDENPGTLDVKTAVDGFLSGETHVSFGLLTQLEFTENGRAKSRVLGPSWTRATRVTLFVNGFVVESVEIPKDNGSKAGVKWEQTWTLPQRVPGSFLVAIATGPGVEAPFWPMMPPYQTTTADFEPYVMGISPARWVK